MATLSLCLIAKNEAHNLPILMQSIEGCFDEIILVDTGSTDNTVELAKQAGIRVFHFEWVFDFSKARNFAFSKATCDYVMWVDLDDSLAGKENFKEWKENLMPLANHWLATYDYASNEKGEPICSFARERVVKRGPGFEWEYFVHEGIKPTGKEPFLSAYACSWSIKHRRTKEDLLADKGRNLKIFEANLGNFDTRMLYYYGKELFENGRTSEAYTKLLEAAKKEDLDHFDRILALQYAATCAGMLKHYPECIDIAIRGLQIAPTRAEFFVAIGEAYQAQGKIAESIPYFSAATKCRLNPERGKFAPPIYSAEHAYAQWPRLQLARSFYFLGDLDRAQACVQDARQFGHSEEVERAAAEIERIKKKIFFPAFNEGKHTEDVIISAPIGSGFYEWDEDVYRTYGCGGSETAAIEIARQISLQTGRKVFVYNDRKIEKTYGNVSYRSNETLPDYLNEHIPKWHLQWRHADRITNAKSTAWLHDLAAIGVEKNEVDSIFALSPFHKRYLTHLHGVNPDKIIVTRNGVDPTRWAASDFSKKRNIVVFPSSPDRGLDRALLVMDRVVKEMPEVEFRAFYGFENMTKAGHHQHVSHLQQMFNERPWATMVGNINQYELTQELCRAKVWLYPTNFNETFCITALECALSKVYPVVRSYGALPDTLSNIPSDIISRNCETPSDIEYYAERTIAALKEEKWQLLRESPLKHSWQVLAAEWIQLMNLR